MEKESEQGSCPTGFATESGHECTRICARTDIRPRAGSERQSGASLGAIRRTIGLGAIRRTRAPLGTSQAEQHSGALPGLSS